MSRLTEALQDKDNNKAYALSRDIAAKSAASNEYYSMFDELAGSLTAKSSYLRTRGFALFYTANAARSIEEGDVRGTLEPGKAADFFSADRDFFNLSPEEVVDFRPSETWYASRKYRQKKGTVTELLAMMLSKPKKI